MDVVQLAVSQQAALLKTWRPSVSGKPTTTAALPAVAVRRRWSLAGRAGSSWRVPDEVAAEAELREDHELGAGLGGLFDELSRALEIALQVAERGGELPNGELHVRNSTSVCVTA